MSTKPPTLAEAMRQMVRELERLAGSLAELDRDATEADELRALLFGLGEVLSRVAVMVAARAQALDAESRSTRPS